MNVFSIMKGGVRRFVALAFLVGVLGSDGSAQYALNGAAVNLGGDCFRLTTPATFQNASVWYLNQVNISQSFDLIFQVKLGCNDAFGADGMAFVLQRVSTSVGSSGGGLGFAGISPSIAVELDTWQNSDVGDPSFDHIAVLRNGSIFHNNANNLAGPVSISAATPNVEDCNYHDFRVTWNADSMILRAYFDCVLRITYTGNIVQSTFSNNPMVFWGFTAATGSYTNEQAFCLDFVSFYEALSDTAICPGSSLQLDAGAGDTYIWNPSANLSDPFIQNPIASPPGPTTYTVQVTDGCVIRYDTIQIGIRPPVTDILPPQAFLCNGSTLVLNASTEESSYLWFDGSTDSTAVVSQPGTYGVTVFTPCDTVQDSIVVLPQAVPTLNLTQINCNGNNNGSALAAISSVPPYTFTWKDSGGNILQTASTGSSQNLLSGLSPGIYSLDITDGIGCDTTLNFAITEPPVLNLSLVQQQNINCGGANTGSFQVLATGGTAPYQFSVSGTPFQNSPNYNNLAAGTYNCIVRDANNCLDTVVITLTQNPVLSVSITQTISVACFGGNTGKVFLSGNGGSGGYSYSLNGSLFQPNPFFTGLSAGTYTAWIRDGLNCTKTVSFSITEPTPLALQSQVISNVNCFGNATGVFSVNASGGVGNYLFSFQNGPFTGDTLYSNLAAGIYPINIQDDSGCVATFPVQITEPPQLIFQNPVLLMVDCFGNNSGLATLSASGGTAPWEFSLSGGTYSSSPVFQGLAAGSYTFVVRDDSSCTDSQIVTITEPLLLTASVNQRQDVDCFGNNTGVLGVAGAGGTLPFQYAINAFPFQNQPVFDSLYAGFYTLSVLDANGCLATVDTVVTTPTGLAIGIDQQNNVGCFGDSTGQLTFQAIGGTGPYQYTADGFNFFPLTQALINLPASSDTLLGYDANGCLVPIPYYITQPQPLTFAITGVTEILCFNDSSATLTLHAAGGTLPYLFSLNGNPSQTDSVFSGLPAGAYSIVMQDDSGCVATVDTVISEPSLLSGGVDSLRNVDCWGNKTGRFSIGVTGGTGLYTYQLDNAGFGVSPVFDSLAAGTYQVVVRDDNACTDTVIINLTQPDTLIARIFDNQPVACFRDSSGSLQLSVSGGTSPYIFSVNNGNFQTDSLFANWPSGTYNFIVTDSQGCIATVSDTLTEPPLLVLTLDSISNVRCYGEANGIISVSATGGVNPYNFQLNGGLGSPDSLFDELSPGNYDILLTDANGCTQQLNSILISEPDTLVVSLQGENISCHSGSDGSLNATISGGNLPYTILWNDPSLPTVPSASGLRAGLYQIQITDRRGCTDTSSLSLTEPDTLLLGLVSVSDAFCDWDNGFAAVSALGGTMPYTFYWDGLPGLTTPEVNQIFGGSYIAWVTDAQGCTDSISVFVGNTPPAVPEFTTLPPTDTTITLSQQPLQMVNTSQGAAGYEWNFGVARGMSDLENPTFTYTDPGIYTITLTTYNEYWVCPTTYSLTIEILPDGAIFYPNAFTPNDDGYNDIFYFGGEGVVEMEALIFSRWGEQIARIPSLDQGWNGYLQNANPAPEGVYTYIVKGTFNTGAKFERAGTITLIR
ncbi:MAG: gliding motility-associated C-terminal domain-containing protein [Bacteroidia bacterium]|nr:gliding motility-associated C-terminal domain-containing protein [Bacteroidia bacterium]